MLILALCLCPLSAWAEEEPEIEAPTDAPASVDLYPFSFSRVDGVMRDFNRPSKQTFALQFGPKLLELRANYWEKRQDGTLPVGSDGDPNASRWGRYFDLFAKSSQFDGKLVGESEIAYSALGFSPLAEQQPLMARLGVNGKWGKAGYGLSYRSFGQGFVPLAGARVEHDRDESQLWGEYDFGLFRLRGAAGETLEKDSFTQQLTLTRTAATSFHVNKPTWSMRLSSSYSSIDGSQPLNAKSFAFANGLALIYRPVHLLTLEPNVNFRHEWEPGAGPKTDTPSAGFALAYTPLREFQLVGRASFSKNVSEDPLRDASIVNTTAGLNWKLGKSFFGEQSVSLQVEYKNESRPTLPENLQTQLTGTVQFKIAGF
jgi:hypothetical protein